MIKFVVIMPYSYRPYYEECLATIKLPHEFIGGIDNTIENKGVAASWNMGINLMRERNADWLIICSAAIRFGEAGGRDMIEALETRPNAKIINFAQSHIPEQPYRVDPELAYEKGVFYWHLIAIHKSVFEELGTFDDNFYPCELEDTDFDLRVRRYMGHENRIIVPIDAKPTTMSHGVKLGSVIPEPEKNIAYFKSKWGMLPGQVMVNGKWPLYMTASSSDEWLGNMRTHDGEWEPERLNKLHELIKDGTVVMYIGAYKGDMPALLASWGAKLIIMESTPAFWTLIEEMWRINKLPEPIGFWSGLVSNETKLPTWIMPSLTTWPTRKAEYIEGKVGFTHLAESGEDIFHFPQITIDDFVERSGLIPDIITMDVEGSELEVMKGAINTIKKYKPDLLLSEHPEFMFHNHGSYIRELHDLIERNGYNKAEFLAYDHEFHFYYHKKEDK